MIVNNISTDNLLPIYDGDKEVDLSNYYENKVGHLRDEDNPEFIFDRE